MPRRLLEIVPSPRELLTLTDEELAFALLEDMQARGPIDGMLNRNLSAWIITPTNSALPPQEQQKIVKDINRKAGKAIDLLQSWELAEPAEEPNGKNGYIILTEKGKATTEQTNMDRIRARSFLKKEMLHPSLQGKIYEDFQSDHLGDAVFGAFRLIEIKLRESGKFPEKEIGKELAHRAFAIGGPLLKGKETKADSEALAGLFGGALHRFKNPGSHTERTFSEVLMAIEELMFASRLLRMIEERNPNG